MSALKEDGVKELIRIVGEVLIVVLLVLLGLKELSKRTQQSLQPMKTMRWMPCQRHLPVDIVSNREVRSLKSPSNPRLAKMERISSGRGSH